MRKSNRQKQYSCHRNFTAIDNTVQTQITLQELQDT